MHTRYWMLLGALASTAAACGTTPRGSGNPSTDAGTTADMGAPRDTGSPPQDTGTPPADTGTPPADTGTPKEDSGVTPEDAGIPVEDAGVPVEDAGIARDDVPAPADTGTPPLDGGSPGDGGSTVLPDVSGPYNPCAPGAVIDLNTTGTRDGETTRYTGNNLNVPAASVLPSACIPTAGHQVVLRYVPRASTRLRISTDNAGTGATFDTVVYVQRMCAPSGGDAGPQDSLGCNDDGAATGSPRRYASALTTEAVTMGQAVYIVVAGYLGTNGQPVSGFMPRGTFELTVTEIATVAVGAACDPAGQSNTCMAGSYCFTASGTSTCRAFVAAGAACNSTDARCAAGNTCVTPSGAMMGTCRADGTVAGTACRAEAPRCAAPLECTTTSGTGTCIEVVATGGTCNTARRCAADNTCITPSGATEGTCRAHGTVEGAACRTTTPRCDMGLDCTASTGAGTCRRVVPVGQPCVLASTSAPCAAGSLCNPNSPTMGVCTTPASGVTPGTMPMGAPASSVGRVYGGSFAAMGQHCYGVNIPAGASLFVQSGLTANPGCSGGDDPLIRVHNPAGTQIASFDDTSGFGLCAVGNPASSTALRGLAAGTYAVCITGYNGRAVMGYLLTVGIIPAAP